MLHAWLSGSRLSKNPGPIRDMLRDVILETTPLSKGHMLLGKRRTHPTENRSARHSGAQGSRAGADRSLSKRAKLGYGPEICDVTPGPGATLKDRGGGNGAAI